MIPRSPGTGILNIRRVCALSERSGNSGLWLRSASRRLFNATKPRLPDRRDLFRRGLSRRLALGLGGVRLEAAPRPALRSRRRFCGAGSPARIPPTHPVKTAAAPPIQNPPARPAQFPPRGLPPVTV